MNNDTACQTAKKKKKHCNFLNQYFCPVYPEKNLNIFNLQRPTLAELQELLKTTKHLFSH